MFETSSRSTSSSRALGSRARSRPPLQVSRLQIEVFDTPKVLQIERTGINLMLNAQVVLERRQTLDPTRIPINTSPGTPVNIPRSTLRNRTRIRLLHIVLLLQMPFIRRIVRKTRWIDWARFALKGFFTRAR